jgi:hypothetical protein
MTDAEMLQFDREALQRTLTSQLDTQRSQLRMELTSLRQRVDGALRDLALNNKQLDEHLIVNASSISGRIARLNLVLDLCPYAGLTRMETPE